jgi:hypothetical protein
MDQGDERTTRSTGDGCSTHYTTESDVEENGEETRVGCMAETDEGIGFPFQYGARCSEDLCRGCEVVSH